jgi:4'-phosphopantetheinyl transferase
MIELWLVDLKETAPALAALERETPRLSDDDRRRALCLRDAEERRLRLAAYGALRIALERWGGERVRRTAYRRNASGSPSLAGIPAFSLSHADSVALIGVTSLRAIGVDLEKQRRVRISARRRNEILAAGAGLGCNVVNGPATDRAFLQAWVRLEAYAKALGEGLGRVLDDLQLRAPGRGALSLADIEAGARRQAQRRALRVIDLVMPANLLGAVALEVALELPELRRFPADLGGVRRLLPAAGDRLAERD